jgi:adenylate kinase family enzyme
MGMIILIFGLPGVGKTALAKEIVRRTDAIHLNADDVRSDLSLDLSFNIEDRAEQARRLGAIARLLRNQGRLVVVDFINPTLRTRESFGDYDYSVWVDRTPSRVYEDTSNLFQIPEDYNVKISDGMSVQQEAVLVMKDAKIHDWTEPTTLMLGRYQPWHEGHQALKNEAHKRTVQVLVGVRNTEGTSEKDPLPFEDVCEYIQQSNGFEKLFIRKLPNITNIVYGRDVGYRIEQIDLPPEIQAISATQKRKELGI